MTTQNQTQVKTKPRKTVQVKLDITTNVDNFTLCEHIQKILENSSIGASEYLLTVIDIKVTNTQDTSVL